MKAVNTGITGCGNISEIYLTNLTGVFNKQIRVTACADLVAERAGRKAAAFPGVAARTTEDLLADPAIELVVNLTTPSGHAALALQAVAAGKSVYNEKPLTLSREDGRTLLAAAERRGVLVGGAPDTFLGAGLQTCRQLMDEGAIGRPVAATAFMMCRGHEGWHPDPEFYYQAGGGPMFDMGPYYLTALVSLLGPVARVTGSARISYPERVIRSQPKAGARIRVEVPTHVAGVLDFAAGPVATIVTSFDVSGSRLPCIEIYGSEGTLSVPDPNTFGGPVHLQLGNGDWTEAPIARPYAQNSRGLGAADLACALRSGRPHRASGQLAFHVLDIMHAIHEASAEGRHVELSSTCERPAPLPALIDR